ncbi:MAG: zf-HC2 domain-containing protein [Planctomycetia bacterium]|nr:zf-HC2 domain-containing protein [Planctomycetia bacterium]
MIWNNECRKARRLLALAADNDLNERDASGVERHLAVCPQCREVRKGLLQAQQAFDLARPSAEPGNLPAASVWPGVSRHIRAIDAVPAAPGWYDWLPTGALAAACLALLAVLLPSLRFGDVGDRNSALTTDSDRAMFGFDARRFQPVSDGNDRSFRSPLDPPSNPDSYRNF